MSTQLRSNSRVEKAVCYLRVSTTKQKDEGSSLDVQEKLAKSYAAKNNLDIIKTFTEAKSAYKVSLNYEDVQDDIFSKINDRSILDEMLKYMTKEKIKHLIIYSKDRLSRNVEVALTLDLFFSKQNITVHCTRAGEDVKSKNDAINQFLKIVFASVAELESNLISQRVKDGLMAKVNLGYWPGGKYPFGYSKASHNGLQKNLTELALVNKIYDLYTTKGYSYKEIANELQSNDEISKIQLNAYAVQRILKNPIYCGQLSWNMRNRTTYASQEKISISHRDKTSIATISENQSITAQTLINNKNKDSKYYNTQFLLKGKLICGQCNSPMIPLNYGTDRNGKQRDNVYRCSSKQKCKTIIKQNIIEPLVLNKILDNNRLNPKLLWEAYLSKLDKSKALHENLLCEVTTMYDSTISNELKITNMLEFVAEVDIVEALERELIHLKNEQKNLKLKQSQLSQILAIKHKSFEEFNKSLNTFFSYDFDNLDFRLKRLLIDILIESVTAMKSEKGINIEIVANTRL